VSWQLTLPWRDVPLRDAGGALFWPHRLAENNFAFWARKVEAMFVKAGIPSVNSGSLLSRKPSFFLDRWRTGGLSYLEFGKRRGDEFEGIAYPSVLQYDDLHHLQRRTVANAGEARAVLQAQRNLGEPPFNLATGLQMPCHRALVIGDSVLWEGRGQGYDAGIARAARAIGSDVVALDFYLEAGGRCVFCSADPGFMAVDGESWKLATADDDLREAFAELLLQRLAGTGTPV
jgi:hypothetical protein